MYAWPTFCVARCHLRERVPDFAALNPGYGWLLPDMIPVTGQRIDDSDLLDREVGDDLDRILVHNQHLLDAHAVAEALAVLRFQGERHAFLDLDRMIKRPDARNDRLIILRKPQPMAPQVRSGLVLVFVAPGFHGRWPLLRDLPRRGPDSHGADRVIEPLQSFLVRILLLLRRLLADAIGAVIAGLVAVPGQRGQVHENDVAGLDDAIGKIAPVRPGVRTGRDDHVLDVLHAGNIVEVLHEMRRHLVLGDAGAQELHAFPVRGVADGADDAHAFLLIDVLDGARFHHRRHAVDPGDVLVPENANHVDVDEIDAEFLSGHAVALHFLDDGIGELGHLLGGSRAGGALDPGEGVADVFFRQPGRVTLHLKAEIALLEKHRGAVPAQHRIAQTGLEPVPSRSERAGDVAYVFIVHAKQGAEAVLLHHLARPLGAVCAQPIPVDALLPIQTRDTEICSHEVLPCGRRSSHDRTHASPCPGTAGVSLAFPLPRFDQKKAGGTPAVPG